MKPAGSNSLEAKVKKLSIFGSEKSNEYQYRI